MATGIYSKRTARTVEEARAVNELSNVVRVNRVPIQSFGAVASVAGPTGQSAPLSSITYRISNKTGSSAMYVIGDPNGTVRANMGAAWVQPTSVKFGSVAAVQESFANNPITVSGLNYIVSDAKQYEEGLMYVGGDRDGRFHGQPIDLDAILRNNQEIATRQTIKFLEDYLLDALHGFVLTVADGVDVTLSLLIGANNA